MTNHSPIDKIQVFNEFVQELQSYLDRTLYKFPNSIHCPTYGVKHILKTSRRHIYITINGKEYLLGGYNKNLDMFGFNNRKKHEEINYVSRLSLVYQYHRCLKEAQALIRQYARMSGIKLPYYK